MAMNLSEDDELRAEINVTPLVDVVLVLLVIFMVVTPLIKQEVPIELPLAENSKQTQDLSQLILTVLADGSLLLNRETIPREELTARLTTLYATRSDKTTFLEADRDLLYDRVVQVMDECRAAGVTTIGVLTKKPETAECQKRRTPMLEARNLSKHFNDKAALAGRGCTRSDERLRRHEAETVPVFSPTGRCLSSAAA